MAVIAAIDTYRSGMDWAIGIARIAPAAAIAPMIFRAFFLNCLCMRPE